MKMKLWAMLGYALYLKMIVLTNVEILYVLSKNPCINFDCTYIEVTNMTIVNWR